ncbi:MAG: hypothetical protein EBZ36_16740, partial [Acidobacteria bacterium]|nr:hypothetical protein [Acidobacteriota bacterium]
MTPGTAARLVVVTQPIGGASGAVLATQPVVHVRDAQNNTVLTSNAPVTASIFSGAGTLGGTVTVNAVAGVATFGNLTLAGQVSSTYVLRFTSGSLTLIDSNSLNLSGPGVATQLVLTTQPVAGISGAAFTTQPRLEIRDSGGNVVTSSTDEVKATILTGTGGVLSGGATVNASGGFVSFSNLSLAGLVGTSYIIQFSSSGMASVSSNSVSVAGPGTAALLAIVSQPVGGSSGGPLATQPVIAVRDTGGNTITSSGVQVSVAISSGSGGTLTGTTSINASAGMAMFSGLTFAGTVGVNYKFMFSAPGLVAATSNDVTVSAGSPGQLLVTTQPVGGLSGGQLT